MIDLKAIKSIPLPEIKRFITFLVVGGINTILGLGFILWLSEGLHVHYLLANAIGYGLGLFLSFVTHRNITFRDVSRTGAVGAQFGKFATIFVISYFVQFGALFVMVHILHWPNWFSQIVACGLYVVVSFAGSRLITFRGSGPGKSS